MIAHALRQAASTARRRVQRFASLMAHDAIVARRYVGTLGGVSDDEPLNLFYVGREAFACEFEMYFRASAERKIEPTETTFHGNLAQYTVHRRQLAHDAEGADFVASEVFPGAIAEEHDALHYPMLDGSLAVRRSVTEQIRRVRSRAQRRLMRDVLRSNKYRAWVESSAQAFDTFHTTLHEPYVRRRFGAWGSLDDSDNIRRLYAKSGCILFVADRARPSHPVCGTLLLDGGGGELAYQFNGFVDEGQANDDIMAERTTALELALVDHAITHRFTRIDVGYTRAILNDGLFTHKRRLGCNFAPVRGSPLFRVRARPTRRAAIYARYPLLVGAPGAWTAMLGYDDTAPSQSKKGWHATLKNFRVPGLASAVVWTKVNERGAEESIGERSFREAVAETLDLPEGAELRRDE